jgi:hypothetical protein
LRVSFQNGLSAFPGSVGARLPLTEAMTCICEEYWLSLSLPPSSLSQAANSEHEANTTSKTKKRLNRTIALRFCFG